MAGGMSIWTPQDGHRQYNAPLKFQPDDGGRAEAGFKGFTGDCVCRSIAIASDRPYREVYDELNVAAQAERPRGRNTRSHSRTGVGRGTIKRYLTDRGWRFIATMGIGTGCRVHLAAGELPEPGRLIVSLSRHYTAVWNGVVRDTYDPCRGGSRCVYGFWYHPSHPLGPLPEGI